MKVTCSDLTVIISYHSEIAFRILGDLDYNFCWMGYKVSTGYDRPYWFGLTSDGKQGYDYKTFDEMLNAPVFHGQSLKDLIDKVDILSIDACTPELMYHSNNT